MTNKIQASFAKFVQPLDGSGEIGNISLFVISTKNPGLKKLNLEGLSAEEKAARLKILSEKLRFVLVIEACEGIVAYVHKNYASDLDRSGSLLLDGKKFTVRLLSDEEAVFLAAIGTEWEGMLTDEIEGEKAEEKDGSRADDLEKPLASTRSFYNSLTGCLHNNFLFSRPVKNKISQLILNCMKRFQEERRELEKQKAIDEKKSDIIRCEIKRQILREDIKKNEIQHQELRRFDI